MNYAVLHSGVQKGPRLVYSEGRLLCRPIFYLLFMSFWHNYEVNGSFMLLQDPGFPVCLCSTSCFVIFFFSFFFFFLPDSRDRSPGARGVLGLGDEV